MSKLTPPKFIKIKYERKAIFVTKFCIGVAKYKKFRYNNIMDIKSKVSELPNSSGVYIMKNINGEVIYVGKAKNLKNRVSQYFQSGKTHTIKVKAMVSNIADFSYVVVANEYEAFALENNLIKRYQPFYNILLKDGKSYPYIRIDLNEEYPRPSITRKLKKDGAKYFGPFFAGVRPQEILKAINMAYPIRMCKGGVIRKQKRACINHDIGMCSAPCVGAISKVDYDKIVKKVISFLNGDYKEVKEILTEKMLKCADNEQFETALMLRDTLSSLDRVGQHTLAFLPSFANLDCFAYATNGSVASIAVLVVRGGRSVGVDCFHIINADISEEEAVSEFISQYYSSVAIPPEEIIVGYDGDNTELIKWVSEIRVSSTLADSRSKVSIIKPKKGDKKKLYDMAKQNAVMYIEKFVEKDKRDNDYTVGAVTQLGEILNLKNRPSKIECYDISNIGGALSVASMVSFVEGEPRKSYYRKFKIKTVSGSDDFASMQEVIIRRLSEVSKGENDPSFGILPDLIVVDGGKGQLSNAVQAIKKMGYDIPVISLAKREEEVYVPNRGEPLIIPRTHNALKLLQRVRDESHRFAITFHRSLRNKVSSILEEIDGIGEKKRKALYRHYKSIEVIKNASIEELERVPGITKQNAINIYKYFNES